MYIYTYIGICVYIYICISHYYYIISYRVIVTDSIALAIVCSALPGKGSRHLHPLREYTTSRP